MRIFMTGASGWIGSATTAELLAGGHQVIGLARSDESAATIEALGASVVRGDLGDLDSLRRGAADSDGVIHLGYIHDFSQIAAAADTDRAAITAIAEVLEGSDRPLLIASGTLGLNPGGIGTELDRPTEGAHPRVATGAATLALADRGVRSIVARFAPTVHGAGDHGFIAELTRVARDKGVAGYIGDGSNRWPAIHRSDAGRLVALAIEKAPAGSAVHAIAEQGVSGKDIASAIGRGLGVAVESIPAEQAIDHFGWIGMFFGMDAQASNDITRAMLGWEPTGPTLIEDLDAGHYFS